MHIMDDHDLLTDFVESDLKVFRTKLRSIASKNF